MRGAIPPLSQYAFMAWCSVKSQVQRYLYLIIIKREEVGAACNTQWRNEKCMGNLKGTDHLEDLEVDTEDSI
jgi:hypothetical protein